MVPETFTDLWGCRETVRDGECSYGCEFFVRAKDRDTAEIAAWEYVKRNYVLDNGETDPPYTELLNEDGVFELDSDYRTAEAEVCQQIDNLERLFQFLHIPA